jgi:hypothetical protein
MTIQVKGVASTLRDLGKINPSLKKELNKDIRNILKPMLSEINQSIPSSPPLSGMAHNGRTGWPNRKNALIKIDTRKPRRGLNGPSTKTAVNIVRIVTKGAPVAIVDMAGKGGGTTSRREPKYQRPTFARSLPGDPSRFMWKNAEKTIASVEREMNDTIKAVVFRANQELMKVKI